MKIGFVVLCSIVVFVFCSFVPRQGDAAPSFTSITDSDFTQITKEMSANFTHNSMMGASKLGTVFGFEVGLVGAQTGSPNTNAIAQRTAGSGVSNLYNGGVIVAVGVPFGLSGEVVMLPSLSASGSSFSSSSYALKLNMNELIPVLPLNLAVRGVYSNAKFSFSQTISGLEASVDNKTSVTGVQLLLSPKLPVFEPYIGVGMLSGSNELSVTGTSGTVFDPSFSIGQSEKKTASSSQFLVGAEVSLLLIKFGAEYSQCFGASRTGIKIAVGF